MPRQKTVLRYACGIVEYEYRDETHWAQMVGTTLVRCDNKAKKSGYGLVSQFNHQTGARSTWHGALPQNTDPTLWIKDKHVEVYETEVDVF